MAGRPYAETLKRLLTSFERSAWRLEALDCYEENEACRAYLRGDPQPPPNPGSEGYRDNVRALVSQGRTIGRVHAIAGPLTPYLRFEIEWGYAFSEPAGDDVRILHRPSWDTTPFGHQPPDFWIFDDATVAVMRYAHDGRWLGLDLVENPPQVAASRQVRDLAIKDSVSFREYLALMRRASIDLAATTDGERVPT